MNENFLEEKTNTKILVQLTNIGAQSIGKLRIKY